AELGQDAGVALGFDGSTNPATGSAILSAGDSSDLLAGLWYINLHTENFMGGEIRGQIFQISPPAVVPLPAAVWLMLSAVAGLGALRRRK
ncbi:MAG: VPLPA-CTERM sorting domain-containing protein, partial [Gammaproteobacteria bacterium]|nr:VPLPA-CTERM sorting domain-containing protein [Gammaproteobacteria bacterium]